jgi:hypothetical protein
LDLYHSCCRFVSMTAMTQLLKGRNLLKYGF